VNSPAADTRAPVSVRLWKIDALLTPATRRLAFVVIAASFFFPLGGLKVDLCLLHASTGLPCPGCGMTRALSAISQGEFGIALGLNPFAYFAWPAFLGLVILSVLPSRVRTATEARIKASGWAGKAYQLIFFAFLGFGAVRLIYFLAAGERFP